MKTSYTNIQKGLSPLGLIVLTLLSVLSSFPVMGDVTTTSSEEISQPAYSGNTEQDFPENSEPSVNPGERDAVIQSTILIDKSEIQMKPGENAKLTASIINPSSLEFKFVWRSSDNSVASVDSQGRVRAIGLGNAIITVSDGDKTATCEVKVCELPAPVSPTYMHLDVKKLVLEENSFFQLHAIIMPENTEGIIWSSDDTNIATVDEAGIVKSHSEGRTVVHALYGDLSCECEIEIIDSKSTGILLAPKELILHGSVQVPLIATNISDIDSEPVIWESSDESVLKVDDKGVVTTLAPGEACVTVNYGSNHGICKINVEDVKAIFTISLNEASIHESETLQVVANVYPANAFDKEVCFESLNPKVATVNKDGLLRARLEGEVIIKCGETFSKVTVLPTMLPSRITLGWTGKELNVGDSYSNTAYIDPRNVDYYTDETVKWRSDDDAVASVDEDGIITANGVGWAVISATTINDLSDYCLVRVKEPDAVVVENMEYDGILYNLKSGKKTASVSSKNEYEIINKHNLVIPEVIVYEGIQYRVTEIEDNAFGPKYGIEKNLTGTLTLPKTIEAIGDYAFNCGSDMTGPLILPESLKYIGEGAFKGCGFTGSLIIPDSVVEIGNAAFNSCTGFTGDLVIGKSVRTIGTGAFSCTGFKGDLIIGDSVITIGHGAFYCTGFTGSLEIGKSVETIGDNAFYECIGFKGDLIIGEAVRIIGGNAFYKSGFTGDLIIGNSVESIGKKAFYDCTGFSGNLRIGDSVRTIGEDAFEYCSNFSGELILGNSLETIYKGAFSSCYRFTGPLIIPDNVVEICNAGLDWIDFTGYLVIGSSVNLIDCDICSKFDESIVICKTVIPPSVDSNRTLPSVRNSVLYVPYHSVERYKSSDYWGRFYSIKGVKDFNHTILLNYEELYLNPTETHKLVAAVLPKNSDETVRWSSSDDSVAEVNEKGVVTAISNGDAIITASCDNLSASCRLTVGTSTGLMEFKTDESVYSNLGSDAKIEVYNLNGIKVADSLENLRPGFYIVRKGNTINKIMVK